MRCGVNYWASNAGTRMWRDWDAKVVAQDFDLLKSTGVEVVRVFPNWEDFQPIEMRTHWRQLPHELRFPEGKLLPDTPLGRCGLSEEMVGRFRTMCDLAEERGLKLIVALLVGWMSGEMYVPPALKGRNVFTDPLSLKWQTRFLRGLVTALKDCPAIEIWELGNECNCMGAVPDEETAWNWTNMVVSTIRLADPTRPVSSGMHGLRARNDTEFSDDILWTIQTQGELCDFVTGHPYPFSMSKPPARIDSHFSIRTAMQAAVEARMYGDIGGKPGFVEEIGTFAPNYCCEETKATFLRNSMLNSWAYGSDFFLWWCAFEQDQFRFPPYDWCQMECYLGLFNGKKTPRPVAKAMADMTKRMKSLPFAKLPSCRKDALCVLTREFDFSTFVSTGWTSFLLAKEAGFDVEFAHITPYLPKHDCYIIPSIRGDRWATTTEYQLLLSRVKAGATMFISMENASLAPYEEVFGCETVTREARNKPARIRLGGKEFSLAAPYKQFIRPMGCEVLATEEDGNPIFLRNKYGKGQIYLLLVPIENNLGTLPGAFDQDGDDWAAFYRTFGKKLVSARRIVSSCKLLTLTEHVEESTGRVFVIAVNNGNEDLPSKVLFCAKGWKLAQKLPATIPAHDGILLELRPTR